MNVLLSCVMLGLLASSHAHYRVSFNNNFKLNGRSRQGQTVGGHKRVGGGGSSDELETYLVGIESYDEERDDTKDHFVGFRADLFHKIAHHGECKIRLVETKTEECIAAVDDDVPFAQGGTLKRSIVDGCADFFMVPELNWVASTSDAYTKEVTYGLRLLKDGTLDNTWKIRTPWDDFGTELTLQLSWLTGVKKFLDPYDYIRDDDKEAIEDTKAVQDDIAAQVDKLAAGQPADYDAVFAPEEFFTSLPSPLAEKLNVDARKFGGKKVDIAGLGIVARPDADGLISCFNDGLEAIREHGRLEALCKEYKIDDCDLEGDDDEDDDDDDDNKPDTTPKP